MLLLFASLYGKAQTMNTFLESNGKSKREKKYYDLEEREYYDTIYRTMLSKKSGIKLVLHKFHKATPDFIYQIEYYSSGMPISEGAFQTKRKHGVWKYYSDWGLVARTKTFENDIEKGIMQQFNVKGTLRNEKYIERGFVNGFYKNYYSDGLLSEQGIQVNSKKYGRVFSYDKSGKIDLVSHFISGKAQGTDSVFKDGNLYKTIVYVDDKKQGPVSYFENNKVVYAGIYVNDSLQKNTILLDSGQLIAYGYTKSQSNEVMPQFISGDPAMSWESRMMKFVSENLDYPEEARIAEIEGKVFVRFTVDKDGSIKDIDIMSDLLGYGCEKAAYTVVSHMPRWAPGMQNGISVPVYFNLPIRFRLF